MSKSGTIEFRKSLFQVVNRAHSLNLPLNLFHSGEYVAYSYDIEDNQRILDGILYHASYCSFNVSNNQGLLIMLFTAVV